MENWLEFIDYLLYGTRVIQKKFHDNCLYIDLNCNISFHIYLSDDASLIYDILYWSNKSIKESEEFGFYLKNGEFSEINQETVRGIFSTPLKTGWTDVHYYSDEKLIKVDRYYGIGKNKEKTRACTFNIKSSGFFFNFMKSFKAHNEVTVEVEPCHHVSNPT